ncbi:MAG: Coq4 family protein [Alphaproteobacteria bacterium]
MTTTDVTVKQTGAVQPAKTVKRRRNWLAAFRHIDLLRKNNEDTEQVFRIIEALKGDADKTAYDAFIKTEIGQKVIAEKRSAIDFLGNRDWLRSLPDGSLGREYLDFMVSEGLTAEGLRDVSYDGGFAGESEETEEDRIFAEWNRDIHDLFHVVTGYHRDPFGELSVLAVTYQQTKSLGVAFIAIMGCFEIKRILPGAKVYKALRQAFKIGKQCENLVAQDWEYLLTLPKQEALAHLNLREPTHYNAVLDHAVATKTTDPRYQHLFAA